MNRRGQPRPDQRDPNRVTSQNVQYWANGVMRTAQMTQDQARQQVRDGTAFVITSQAVGAVVDGRYAS